MNRIPLGHTSLKVSRFGLGGIQFTKITSAESSRIIHRAVDLGINLIETARSYFDSEERIGQAIKGIRDQVILASKAGPTGYDEFAESIDRSLQAFQIDPNPIRREAPDE